MNPMGDLAEELAFLADKPLDWVMFMYPWDSDPSIQMVKLSPEYADRFGCEYGPDKWACEYLEEWGREIRERNFDGRTPVAPLQMSTSSGHGIGKTTISAWIIQFIMSTRPFSQGTVTATVEPQLRTKTWAELAKWHKRSLLRDIFAIQASRGALLYYHPDHRSEWFAQGITCREENSESFAGQHAANSTSWYLFDEASGVPDKIWEVRLGGLTDGEPMTHDFGNPTRNTGTFYENMMGRFKPRYIRRFIDSRDVAITNKEMTQRIIDDYGEDSDTARVRVKGQFPAFGTMQFIPTDAVLNCMTMRDVGTDRTSPLIIGVDAARYGDDETVVYPRIGRDARSHKPLRLRDPNTITIATHVIEMIQDFRTKGIEYAECFIDGTGGYGGGIADYMRGAGYHCIEVNFGRSSPDPKYRYMADYMWGKLRDALAEGLCLPKAGGGIGRDALVSLDDLERDSSLLKDSLSADLFQQLTGREFSYTLQGNKIHLEPKADMKKRLCSPDLVDALALTYAMPVNPRFVAEGQSRFAKHEYDPFENGGS